MMQNKEVLDKITYVVGSADIIRQTVDVPAKKPFANDICSFLSEVSKILMEDKHNRQYPDVVTFAFWIRGSSVEQLKKRFCLEDGSIHLGRGIAFHIAPSNVPVNFAYSLVAGLLTGNANIVRVPSADFEQARIIANAFREALSRHIELKPYVVLVKYAHDKDVNDLFSSIADTRIIWGGDQTIAEVRKSSLLPRSIEITFADRYSLAVIDSDAYMDISDKRRVAEDFYNDTYLSDQNACTSPRIVVWTGSQIRRAKSLFWEEEHKIVAKKYAFQPIQGINKLTSALLIAGRLPGIKVEEHEDNLIVRVAVPKITGNLMDYKDNSGYFFEYDCMDILEIKAFCNDKRCQTIAYIGDKDVFLPLIESGVKGIDRIVPMGKTMDFDLLWDGYDLSNSLTRKIPMS